MRRQSRSADCCGISKSPAEALPHTKTKIHTSEAQKHPPPHFFSSLCARKAFCPHGTKACREAIRRSPHRSKYTSTVRCPSQSPCHNQKSRASARSAAQPPQRGRFLPKQTPISLSYSYIIHRPHPRGFPFIDSFAVRICGTSVHCVLF